MSADLALAADPSIVERAADPAEFIVQACERGKAWLREALDHGDIEQIVECKSQAEAIRVYTMSKQLGKDAQLSATEIVRRAERGIGVAIRRGQETGQIRSRGQSRVTHQPGNNQLMPSPADFASEDELHGNGAGIYDLTDGVSDDEFEESLEDAKAEGNLSRANVVRKARHRANGQAASGKWIPTSGDRSGDAPGQRRKLIRGWADEGYSSRQMGERLGMRPGVVRRIAARCDIDIPADSTIARSRQLDSNRIVRETVHALEGLAMGAELVDVDDLDPAEIADWTASLTSSIRALNRLIKQMKETVQ